MVLKITPGLFLSAPVTTEDDAQWWQSDTTVVSSVATLINQIVDESVPHKDHLISWLTESSGAGLGDGIAIRRAVVAVLSRDKTDIQTVLDKSLQQFGDQLYIKHTPTLQQDGIVNLAACSCKTSANVNSPYTSLASCSWLRLPEDPSSFINDDEIRSTSQCGLKPISCIIIPGSIFGHGRRRSPIKSGGQRG
jgi:hypothetical protein